MIEIAISLAVIGFALVAIIGIMPLGMNVQRENREETIINHDASILIDAIRTGSRGMDDLTNYVISITNTWAQYDNLRRRSGQGVDWFTPTASSTTPQFALTNGARIVGLLTTPRFLPFANGGFMSNYITANIRAMSGSAADKFPQDNIEVRASAFSYRLIPELISFGDSISETVTNNAWDAGWVNYGAYPTNTPEYKFRARYFAYATNLQNNLHDLRLVFRWPLLPNGSVGKYGRQVYATTVGGQLLATNDFRQPGYPLFFLQPSLYTTNSL
jgi:type II secretory pathway pseudopilin PulG